MTFELPTDYQSFIHISRYARFNDAAGRRETWQETVARYFDFFESYLLKNNDFTLTAELRKELEEAVLTLKVMPSMRALMTAGPALERDSTAGYNCSYVPIDHPRSFDEILYVLMCGTGVGFSVERKNIEQLPAINEHFEKSPTAIVVEDSKAGWSRAYRELISLLYSGQIPTWDMSKVRPAGARLKTFGGRASGPGPLEDLFDFTVNMFTRAAGRKLASIECHDLVCKIASVVVVGGVRRSALISLSDLDDDRMRHCKSGQWWEQHPYRALANNSAVYTDKPPMDVFFGEWKALYDSKSGERGIFNRAAAARNVAKYGRREHDIAWGSNPCNEIVLRPYQFCNLTEVVIRAEDDEAELLKKVRLATILGTFQASLTNFKYLRKIWTKHAEQDALLGVSLTGIYDNALLYSDNELLERLRAFAWAVNCEWSKKLGINPSAAITCVKPSGTVSQLVDAASGIHPRHAEYYIRRVRADAKDPLTQFMMDKGIPHEPDVLQPTSTVVFAFPTRSPTGSVTRTAVTALAHLNTWLKYQRHYCEHKPSITVTVKEDEWLRVGDWVYSNFDEVSGISFLPFDEHTYRQAPYEDITKEQYEQLMQAMPEKIDWTELKNYESEDNTEGSQSLACVGNVCEIVDIAKT